MSVIQELFPKCLDIDQLQRTPGDVDLLIGNDYLGLHPKKEIHRAGHNLSIMLGTFGKCLQETHPRLHEETSILTNFNASTSFLSRAKEVQLESYITEKELGTETFPRCGSCKCGNCPIPGHSFSFKEEQEVSLIRENLTYCTNKQMWTTKYPWVIDPQTLPNNYGTVLATLRSTEKVLQKRVKSGQKSIENKFKTW